MPDDKFSFNGFPENNEEFEPTPKQRRGGSFEDYLDSIGSDPNMAKGMININLNEIFDRLNEASADCTSLVTDFVEFLYSKDPTAVESLFPGIGNSVLAEKVLDFVETNIIPEFLKFQGYDQNQAQTNSNLNLQQLGNMDFDGLLNTMLSSMGIPSEVLSQLGITPSSTPAIEETKETELFELGLTDYLFRNCGNFEFKRNSDVYTKFTTNFGPGPKWESNDVAFTQILTTFNEYTDDILGDISSFKYVSHNDSYLLTYCEMSNPSELGFFMVFVVNSKGEIVGVIPEFGNSLNYNKSKDEVRPYQIGNTTLIDKNGSFTEMDMTKIEAGIQLMFAPVNRPLLSLSQFGTVKNMRISTSKKYSRFVEIGTVTDNDSSEATLFKKDMDLPVEEHEFRFALRFKDELSDVVRNYINDKMLSVDINLSFLAKYNELQSRDSIIFIDVECDNLERIILNEISNREGFI